MGKGRLNVAAAAVGAAAWDHPDTHNSHFHYSFNVCLLLSSSSSSSYRSGYSPIYTYEYLVCGIVLWGYNGQSNGNGLASCTSLFLLPLSKCKCEQKEVEEEKKKFTF